MKTNRLTSIVAGCLLLGFVSCEQKQGAVEEAQETNEQQAEGTAMEDQTQDLSDFMTKAASGGLMEVEVGRMAQKQAQSKQVKDFAQKMVNDHSKANDELKALAAKKNITLPDSMGQDHMDHMNELKGKKGAEFDRSYMDLMVSDHEEDVNLYETASNNLQDAEVKAFASKTLATLRQHREQAQKIDSTLQQKK